MARKRAPIFLHAGMNKSIEDVFILGDDSATLIDCVVDIVGNEPLVSTRPGLELILDLNVASGIDGLKWWGAQNKMVVICNGAGYTINSAAGSKTDLTGSYFTADKRVIMDEGPTNMWGADGANINQISTSAISQLADADAPTAVSHIAFHDQYLLANEIGTKKCHRSDVGDPIAWGSNYFSAESKYDYLKAIGSERGEVLLICEKSLEFWIDTGDSDPFSKLDYGHIPSGTVAPYTFKFCGPPVNSWVWLDHHKNLVMLEGRTTENLSIALNKYLLIGFNDESLDDAAGDFFKTMGHSIYALHLPTEDLTPIYDFNNGFFSNWAYWDAGSEAYERWRGNCVEFAPAWGLWIVGDWESGKIYKIAETGRTDGTDSIRPLMRTEYMDRGDSGATKICNFIDFKVKKTFATGATTITIYVRYREHNSGTWSTARAVTLSSSAVGSSIYVGRLRRLGRYKIRQWEFYTTVAAKLTFYPPIEDYEITYP